MKERFSIVEIHICPVQKVGTSFKPDLEYPTRCCVIDEEKEIAIDINTKLQYDYVSTISHLYFVSQSYKKIKEDKRVAILPFVKLFLDEKTTNESKIIINKLKNGEQFKDGNEVFNNKQYLEYLKQEAIEKTNETKKSNHKLKIFKKGRK